jgi:hypothetical protein
MLLAASRKLLKAVKIPSENILSVNDFVQLLPVRIVEGWLCQNAAIYRDFKRNGSAAWKRDIKQKSRV